MQREEPYVVLTSLEVFRDENVRLGAVSQLLHVGCQMVLINYGLSTSEIASNIVCRQRYGREFKGDCQC